MSHDVADLAVEQAPITTIHPAPWNVRTGHAVASIAESIRINGFRDPIEAWRETGEIVAGEGRYLAAQLLGLADVPVIWHDFDSLASAKRYALANNRLTERSSWDLPALQDQLEDLVAGEGLQGSGFDTLMLGGLVEGSHGRISQAGEERAEHWGGLPEYQEGETPWLITISCDTEADQEQFIELAGLAEYMTRQGRTRSVRWPLREREDFTAYKFVSGGGDGNNEDEEEG